MKKYPEFRTTCQHTQRSPAQIPSHNLFAATRLTTIFLPLRHKSVFFKLNSTTEIPVLSLSNPLHPISLGPLIKNFLRPVSSILDQYPGYNWSCRRLTGSYLCFHSVRHLQESLSSLQLAARLLVSRFAQSSSWPPFSGSLSWWVTDHIPASSQPEILKWSLSGCS